MNRLPAAVAALVAALPACVAALVALVAASVALSNTLSANASIWVCNVGNAPKKASALLSKVLGLAVDGGVGSGVTAGGVMTAI